MGILANRRQRKTEEIATAVKAALAGTLPSPAAGVVTDARPIIDQLSGAASANQAAADKLAGYLGGQNPRQDPNALPWVEPVTAFSPGRPIVPAALDPRLPDTGRALPRISEFPVSWNLPGQGQPLVPWSILRKVAAQVDVIRLCIGVRKKELTSVDWHIAVKQDQVQRLAQEQGVSTSRAAANATADYADEIARVTAFWQRPDRLRRLTFSEWFGMAIEEIMVLDALSIYPHPDMKGSLHSLEIIDGATIKPLLDHRGAFPQPPQPAYQQILWGFPRGEFHLSQDDTQLFNTDELIYRPRERRTWTPYGFSAVEQALVAGDLYMKRQEWLREEYKSGMVPAVFLTPPEALGWTPEQVRQYEANINAELSGNTADRMRARMLPPGVVSEFPANFAEKFKPDLDEYLIKLLCAFFDVMPTEIGITPKGGLGGAGHQSGEANSVQRIGNRPFLQWAADIFNEVNMSYLGAPPELTFVFDLDESEDAATQAATAKSNLGTGITTLNDERAAEGLPLYDFPEADEPMIVTATGPVFLKGMLDQHNASVAASVAGSTTSIKQQQDIASGKVEDPKITAAKIAAGAKPDAPAPEAPADGKTPPTPPAPEAPKPDAAPDPIKEKAELATFTKFVAKRRGRAWRDFKFETVDEETADYLNAMGADQAKAASPKGKARTGPGYESHKALVAHFGGLISQALAAAIPNLDHVARQFITSRTKAVTPGDSAAKAMLESEANTTQLASTLEELTRNAWGAGVQNGLEQLGKTVDWDTWTAGHADAAIKIGGDGLKELLDQQAVTIKSVMDTKINQLANRLSYALDQGWSVDQTADDIANVLSDDSYANMIANTETNRAMTAATMETYGNNGVTKVDWLLSFAPCELCQENADAAPIAYGDDWPNGDAPVHPNCECSIAPAEVEASEPGESDEN